MLADFYFHTAPAVGWPEVQQESVSEVSAVIRSQGTRCSASTSITGTAHRLRVLASLFVICGRGDVERPGRALLEPDPHSTDHFP